jgi:ubiquinone/menaquinone biosynthesis C-methylase UbiE
LKKTKYIKNLESSWTALGNKDPYWAVLTNPEFKDNKWDLAEFYRTGKNQFGRIISDFKEHLHIPWNTVLDFGCGPGRITFQFAPHAKKVIGVDISEPMINLAKKAGVFPDNCTFIVNKDSNLEMIDSGSIDLVFSFITLQHIPPELIFSYLKEFIRIVNKDQGQILFNLVSDPPLYYKLLYRALGRNVLNLLRKMRYRTTSVMEMHWINEAEIINLFTHAGFRLLKKLEDGSAGKNWKSNFYLFEKI